MERKFQAFFPDRKLICGRDSLLGVETATFDFLLAIKLSQVVKRNINQDYLPSMEYLHGSKANWLVFLFYFFFLPSPAFKRKLSKESKTWKPESCL